MSVQKVERFIKETEQNEKLQEQMKAAMEKCRADGGGPDRLFEEAVRPFAEELGLSFTEEEYRGFLKEHAQGQELSIDGLDAVTGGIGDVGVEGTDGSVTVIDQSQTNTTTNTTNTTTTIVQVGPADMSFLSYLLDKFY